MTDPSKILVSGSRSIDDYHVVSEVIRGSPWDMETLVVGDADGVDMAAVSFGKRHDIECQIHPIPEWVWSEVGPKAGPMRNGYMVEQADALVAIWSAEQRAGSTVDGRRASKDGESSGTKDAIKQAESAGLPVYKAVCSFQNDGWDVASTQLIEDDQSSLTEFE